MSQQAKMVYFYNEDFIFSYMEEADLDPEETRIQGHPIYLLPANATFTPILPDKSNNLQKYNPENDSWEYIECHLGDIGYINGQYTIITKLGHLPEGWIPEYEYLLNREKYESSDEYLFIKLRQNRDTRIAKTDYLLISDYPISKENLELVKQYRQALRDITELEGAPWDGGEDKTPWPKLPSFLVKE